MAFTIIFTHTFAFGLIARLDPSGRATAGTPAMLMVGSAVAPLVGWYAGVEAIGYAAIVLVAPELLLFNETRRAVLRAQPASARAAEAAGSALVNDRHRTALRQTERAAEAFQALRIPVCIMTDYGISTLLPKTDTCLRTRYVSLRANQAWLASSYFAVLWPIQFNSKAFCLQAVHLA